MITCCVCGEDLNPSEENITWHEALAGYVSHKACDEHVYGGIDKRVRKRQYKRTDDLL